jgi:serine/threonine protein kinase
MTWASGQQLQGGKYTIEHELGEGDFGITYRAKDNYGRLVVIKTLNDQVQRRPDFAKFQKDFINEAIKLAKCSHLKWHHGSTTAISFRTLQFAIDQRSLLW